ncbi:3-methyladenine DNA glycosylase AlkD [Mucilaginibacter lappiensis]|uniref:3-methyladenine DNA glycosylase AlkD n=1 Tax=Mucilaginibacter lappiensis TaxID=354630 RepID=A0ABR6PU28_9SPHI|nr:DNA alkylation repair protein [Mucilaginibacter lappiensis]MBB6112500.1 3-methyladenine DNA glycosylase AlkD [Mucilaginibacter lappiensis]SIS02438.1 3-methyladenine DNA glycosylase AlkD [Mucilaginibacter lappiensis]
MKVNEIVEFLKQKADAGYLAGMQRYSIDATHAIGVRLPELRKLAKTIKKNHQLALDLWDTGLHEARMLASLIDDPALVTEEQMDNWTKDFNSWDLCDQVCGNLFDRTPFAMSKALEFSSNKAEFIKRAGFVLMAEYAVHSKTATNESFIAIMPIIEREAWDNRNFVKKAVNWALRQIGKRNEILKAVAIQTAQNISKQDHKAAKWIASNALAELIITHS